MKKVLFLSLLLSLSLIRIISQSNLPAVFEIKTDTANHLPLADSNWQMLEDPQGKLTINDVSVPPNISRFHANTGFTKDVFVYWFRFRLKSILKQKEQIAIATWQFAPERLDLFTQDATLQWVGQKTGYNVPWSQRDGLKRILFLLTTLEPGEERLMYERIKLDDITVPPTDFHIVFAIFLRDKVIQEEYVDNERSLFPPFILGIFLVAAFLNLYFFIVVRDRTYLYFSLFITFESLSRFLQDTDTFLEHPLARANIYHACFLFYDMAFIQFVRYFLDTPRRLPRWDKFLIFMLIYVPVFSIVVPFRFISLPGEYWEAMGGESILFFATLTFLFFLNSRDKQLRLKIRPLWPGVFIFLVYTFPTYIAFFSRLTGVKVPDFFYSTYYHKYEQVGIGWLILVFSVSLFKRYQQLQKQVAFEAVEKEKLAKEKEIERSQLIAQQKIELEKQVTERTAELKQSLEELKTTQTQLIQSEKMASLGELTAGIAHEIQNPLNFVNNFSEVNKELIGEMKSEIESGNFNEAKNIANSIGDNEEKIMFHGKRADAIVKSMLQHSRASSGKKEPTDINALADEYFRLAYHGLRAKDKSFNAKMKTDYDASAGTINIVPQDIGRVILNLITNAFYSVMEKRKTAGDEYQPTVTLSTRKFDSKVEVKIKDNGNGISQKVLDKIFQPFFTTKPTGQGTGLGLSLSYDIIKGYGGELKVETKEKEFAEFTILLPS